METHARVAGLACQLAAELAPLRHEDREREMDYFLDVLGQEYDLSAIPMEFTYDALEGNANHSRKVAKVTRIRIARDQALGAA